MFETLARTSYRRRRRVVAAWLGLLVVSIVVSSTLGGDLRNDFTLPGSPSQEATDLLEEGGFVGAAGHRAQIVAAAPRGVDEPVARENLEQLFDTIETEVDGVSVLSPFGEGGQISPDGTVAIADVEFGDVTLDTATERAAEIAVLRDDAALPTGLRVELGGELFYEEAEFSSEGFGFLAAVVILLVAFGSVLAMGLPIVTALFGITCGMAVVLLAAHVLDIPDFAPAAVAMVTIGVGIDYALFLVTRFREELANGSDPETAVIRAVTTAGRAVLFAGTTVVIALMGLLVVGIAATQALAVAISSGVLMAMLASLTLVPALLGFAGHRIDRFSIRRHQFTGGDRTSLWYRWSRAVQRRPAPIALVGFAVILVLTAPVLSMRLGFGDASNRPEDDTARGAFDLVADGFGPGFNGPLIVAARLPSDTTRADVLDQLTTAISSDPGVSFATPALTDAADTVAMIQVFPTTGPQEQETTELVHRLRQDLPVAASPGGAEVHVGGAVAGVVDFADVQSSRMPLFIVAVLAVSFVVLMAVFRSVAVAAKAVILNLLSIGAAYGIIVAVFQWGWGAGLLGLGEPGPIEAWAPMMLFAILFGLSMDYEVFLLSRIKEEYDRTGDNATAVADGLARTARLITAAAGIMIFVFGGFALSDERALQLFGLGLAVAILVDVTIVRLLLVPATMELLGDRNWWLPAWLDRVLPDITLDQTPAAATGDSDQTAPLPRGIARTPNLTGRDHLDGDAGTTTKETQS
jgi:putative drug exporter of the RND superfamily